MSTTEFFIWGNGCEVPDLEGTSFVGPLKEAKQKNKQKGKRKKVVTNILNVLN